MTKAPARFITTCRKCGQDLPPGTETCHGCGTPAREEEPDLDPWAQWSKRGKTMKLQWVASVMAFWVSVGVMTVVYFVKGEVNLILASIALGMLIIGLWLKTKYQLHQRAEPDTQSPDAQSD